MINKQKRLRDAVKKYYTYGNINLFNFDKDSRSNKLSIMLILFTKYNEDERENIIKEKISKLVSDADNLYEILDILSSFYWIRNEYMELKPFTKWKEMQQIIEKKLINLLNSSKNDNNFYEEFIRFLEYGDHLRSKLSKTANNAIERKIEYLQKVV